MTPTHFWVAPSWTGAFCREPFLGVCPQNGTHAELEQPVCSPTNQFVLLGVLRKVNSRISISSSPFQIWNLKISTFVEVFVWEDGSNSNRCALAASSPPLPSLKGIPIGFNIWGLHSIQTIQCGTSLFLPSIPNLKKLLGTDSPLASFGIRSILYGPEF